jgi:imidazolonepropionase
MLGAGTTTIEAKSGYELSKAGELGLLAIGARVRRETPLSVVGTSLAAHVVPPEYAHKPRRYLAEVAWPVALEAHDLGHAEFVDVFVEQGAFDATTARALAKRARAIGMGLRLHVDQLRDGGGALLAASLGADSADHLDFANERGIAALAEAGTTAVLLPGAALTLGSPPPNVAALRRHAVPTAVATDFNPGTSTLDSLVLALALACRMWRLSPEEALLGATEAAARSLRRAGRIGCLRPGADADIVVWGVPDARTLVYHMGPSWVRAVYRRGARVWPRQESQGD